MSLLTWVSSLYVLLTLRVSSMCCYAVIANLKDFLLNTPSTQALVQHLLLEKDDLHYHFMTEQEFSDLCEGEAQNFTPIGGRKNLIVSPSRMGIIDGDLLIGIPLDSLVAALLKGETNTCGT